MQQRLSYERSWAFLLLWLSGTITPVSTVAMALNEKAFLSLESGASALDARSNPMNVGPQLSVESIESMAMVDGYSTSTLGTTG
jgi:hypothetical protein